MERERQGWREREREREVELTGEGERKNIRSGNREYVTDYTHTLQKFIFTPQNTKRLIICMLDLFQKCI